MEERQANQSVAKTADASDHIRRYFASEKNLERLYGVLCSYIKRYGLQFPSEEALRDTAYDVLQNVAETAIAKAGNYHGGAIEAWIFSVANNLVLQKRDEVFKHAHREPLISALYERSVYSADQDAFFEYFNACSFDDPQQDIGVREQIQTALASLSSEDREIVILNKHYGFNHKEIAQRLGLSPVATRVRFSRALERLRVVWGQLEGDKRGENHE